jgi:hypothetical protein
MTGRVISRLLSLNGRRYWAIGKHLKLSVKEESYRLDWDTKVVVNIQLNDKIVYEILVFPID